MNKPETIIVKSEKVLKEDRAVIKKISDTSLLFSSISKVGPLMLRIISKSDTLLKLFEHSGDVAKFILWQKSTFGSIDIFNTKKQHFLHIISEASKLRKDYMIYEFGVAHGYMTDFLLNLDGKLDFNIIKYDAFDTFTGLPDAYRSFKRGSFSNDGLFPDIENPKLVWHKGLVQDSVHEKTFSKKSKIIIFDLDLYAPTLHVFKFLAPNLTSGDVLYFDEAFDSAEFEIIIKKLIPNYLVKTCGTNGQSLAFIIL